MIKQTMNPFKIAKRILKKRGWCKWERHNRDGESCLLGTFEHNAGRSVCLHFEQDTPGGSVLVSIIRKRFADRIGMADTNDVAWVIADFNNHPKTKLRDVNSVLDAAAKQYDNPTPMTAP